MAEEQIDLAFNTDPFEKAMDTIIKGVVRMTNAMEKANQEVVKKDKVKNESMKKGMSNMVAWGIAKFELLKQAFKRVIAEIPEFGTTFKMASDIILKQLLWPLRMQLIPMLQRVMNWVRDNRVVFLRLGTVIANVFRTAMGIMKNFFGVLQSLFEGMNRTLGEMLNFENITEALNVALFKISLLFAFLEAKTRPYAELLGEIFGQIIISVKSFAKGFVDTFINVAESMNIWDDLKLVLEGIRDILEYLSPAFEKLGQIIGTIVAGGLKLAILPLKIMLNFLGGLKDLIDKKIDFGEFVTGLKDVTAESLLDLGKGLLQGGKRVIGVDDAIIKPDGTIIRTNPLDTIMAVKNPEKMSSFKQLSMGDITVNLNVTEGNATQAGINFGNGLTQQIRSIFLDEALATGGIG